MWPGVHVVWLPHGQLCSGCVAAMRLLFGLCAGCRMVIAWLLYRLCFQGKLHIAAVWLLSVVWLGGCRVAADHVARAVLARVVWV
jgi:hypothetical protein